MEIIPRQLRQGQCCGEIQGLYSEKEENMGEKKVRAVAAGFSCMDVYEKLNRCFRIDRCDSWITGCNYTYQCRQ